MEFLTYEQKMEIAISNMHSDVSNLYSDKCIIDYSKTLNLEQLHNIINHKNVIVVHSPAFHFDVMTLKIQTTIDDRSRLLEVKRYTSTFNEFMNILDDSNLVFFYAGGKYNDEYSFSYHTLEIKSVQKYIDRLESIKRMNNMLDIYNTYKDIQDYVNSELFKQDMENQKIVDDFYTTIKTW